jgi:hypothetical protein
MHNTVSIKKHLPDKVLVTRSYVPISKLTQNIWVLGFRIWDLEVSKTCDIVQIPEIIQAPNPPDRKPETQRIRCWYMPSLIEALMWAKFQLKIRNF